jgi:hypothetical protein
MAKRKYDTDSFIKISKEIHGNMYDYSLVEYESYDKKIKIICSKHGVFEQLPGKHMSGQGCLKCFHEKESSDRESFIKKSKEIHGEEFDYTMVKYKNSYTKVMIICKKHGIFEQKPNSHLNGQKCKKCVDENQTSNVIDFIDKSNKIHNNKYDYSLSEYKNNKSKVKVICPIHGEFKQKVSNHLSGSGCMKCKIENTKNNEYIELCKIKFKNKFDYSLIEKYINNKTKVKIICPEHGIFEQTLKYHYKSDGCPYCSGKKMNTELFINKCKKIHNNKYDYSNVEYNGAFKKVKIICPIHGLFEQKSSFHLSGNGCPICKFSKGENEIFGFLRKNNIKFESQKTFDGCVYKSNLYFDFYLPEQNICIEYNGVQHYSPFEFFGGLEGFEIIKKRDLIKKNFCKENKIKLFLINYKNDVNQKLIKLLL